jgi:hypothetical protein
MEVTPKQVDTANATLSGEPDDKRIQLIDDGSKKVPRNSAAAPSSIRAQI